MILRYLITAALMLVAGTALAQAQSFPSRAMRLITPFPPGATTDTLSRLVCAKLNESWGQPCLVDNRPGAAGLVGTEFAAKSAADGYTLVNVISSHVIQHLLHKKISFHPLNDFAPVIGLAQTPNILVIHPSLPPKSLKQFIAIARARNGELVYASAGRGASSHITAELFKVVTGVQMEHVPYKGGAPAMMDLIGGQIPVNMAALLTALPHVQSGKARGIVVTGARRQRQLPDVPTMIESGYPGFEGNEWWVLLAPAGTPRDVVAKLNTEIQRIMALADVKERFVALGLEYIGGSPEDLGAFLRSETEKSSKAMQAAGVKPE
jgi:tripartite-type tricarboxylate transporter receptor subunit TctC